MQNAHSFNTPPANRLLRFSDAGLEVIAWCIALFCSAVDILWRCSLLLFRYTFKLALQLTFALLLAGIFLFAYGIIMGISVAFGPGINSQLP